jgi:hypothetical protein
MSSRYLHDDWLPGGWADAPKSKCTAAHSSMLRARNVVEAMGRGAPEAKQGAARRKKRK